MYFKNVQDVVIPLSMNLLLVALRAFATDRERPAAK